MNQALKNSFPPFKNEQELRSAIESVCARFGRVAFLRILPATGAADARLHCACFLRLDSAEAADRLSAALDVIYFKPDIAFLANVADDWTGPRS